MSPNFDTIVCHALELPADERAAYLEQTCAGDGNLQARLNSKLAEIAAADAFFMEQDTMLESPRRAQDGEGVMIGPYKLLQQIGEGGFGTVWMAEQQQPVRRRVALKIIKAGMDTKEVVARFEQERQALAIMDHPSIARVFDAGSTESGRLYFVMELVKGIPITRFCDEQKLGTRERLALFADVCSAINHAHQKGIIHRDIKPSNVMVTVHDGKPVPKVIDFGIAKATQSPLTDKTLFTRFEQFVGTPVYMSPEQAALSAVDIDTRSDIYALGILLYELLTGRPPFDAQSLISAGYEEMRRIIREVEPPKPSSRLSTVAGDERTALADARQITPDKLSRLVEPDLDWIVMKAIEKERGRRYETANAFALDIQHFLADEPVSASPPGKGYVLRKFARRHRAALRVTAVIALLLVGGTVTSTLLAISAARAKEETKHQLEQTDAALKLVAKERDEKDAALKDAAWMQDFLNDAIQFGDAGSNYADRSLTVATLLDRARENLPSSMDAQPARLAFTRRALGRSYAKLGLTNNALPLQEEALAFYRTAPGYGEDHPDTVRTMADLAWSYDYDTRRTEAIKLERSVLAWYKAHREPGHPDISLATAALGRTLHFNGQWEDGLSLQEEAVRLSSLNPGRATLHTLPLLHWLAVAYKAKGRDGMRKARELDTEILELSGKLLPPEHPETIRAMSAVASHMDGAPRLAKQQEVESLSKKVNGVDHPYTLSMTAFKLRTIRSLNNPAEVIPDWKTLLANMERVLTKKHSDTLWIMTELADTLEMVERNAEDEALVLTLREDAARLSEELLKPEHYNTLSRKNRLAETWDRLGADKAESAFKLRLEILPLVIQSERYGPESGMTASIRRNLATDFQTVIALPGFPPAEAARLRRQLTALGITPEGPLRPVRTEIIPAGSEWKWLHPVDGVDPENKTPGFHQHFFEPGFIDSTWVKGCAGPDSGGDFGYWEGHLGMIGTPEKGKRYTAYFRHTFTTEQTYSHAELRCRFDDGIIVYLDGKEIARANVDPDPEGYLLATPIPISEKAFPILKAVPLGEIRKGTHTLAISLHNAAAGSSDLRLGGLTVVDVEE